MKKVSNFDARFDKLEKLLRSALGSPSMPASRSKPAVRRLDQKSRSSVLAGSGGKVGPPPSSSDRDGTDLDANPVFEMQPNEWELPQDVDDDDRY